MTFTIDIDKIEDDDKSTGKITERDARDWNCRSQARSDDVSTFQSRNNRKQ